jgi:hypothetical protein
MKNYRNLIVWQKAHSLVLLVYKSTKFFPKEEQYNLTSQIRKAATSSQEVEYLSFLSFELGYLVEEEYRALDSLVNEVKAMLISLLQKIRKESNV